MARLPRVELRRARRAGAYDGKADIPGLEQEPLPFELQAIAARHDAEIAGIIGTWRDRDRAVQRDAEQAREELAVVNERASLLTIQRDRLQRDHERRTAQDDVSLGRLQAELEVFPTLDALEDEPTPLPRKPPVESVDRELLEIAGAGAPIPPADRPEPTTEASASWGNEAEETSRRGFGRTVYWSLIFVILVGEIPLNAFAFRLFREADLLTYVMTVTIAVALVACAHGSGVLLTHERSRTERAILAVTLLLPVAVIAVIAVVRDAYLRELAGDTGLGPLIGSFAFGLINLVIFGTAATLSYLHHDPRTRHSRKTARREAERELARAEQRLDHQARDRARRMRRAQDEARRHQEERRRRVEGELEARRQREDTAIAARRDRELEHQAKTVRLRRERVVEAMRPIGDRRRERETALASNLVEIEEALASRVALEHRVEELERERAALRERTEATVHERTRRRETVMLTYCAANVRARRDHATPSCLRSLPEARLPEGTPGAEREVRR